MVISRITAPLQELVFSLSVTRPRSCESVSLVIRRRRMTVGRLPHLAGTDFWRPSVQRPQPVRYRECQMAGTKRSVKPRAVRAQGVPRAVPNPPHGMRPPAVIGLRGY